MPREMNVKILFYKYDNAMISNWKLQWQTTDKNICTKGTKSQYFLWLLIFSVHPQNNELDDSQVFSKKIDLELTITLGV